MLANAVFRGTHNSTPTFQEKSRRIFTIREIRVSENRERQLQPTSEQSQVVSYPMASAGLQPDLLCLHPAPVQTEKTLWIWQGLHLSPDLSFLSLYFRRQILVSSDCDVERWVSLCTFSVPSVSNAPSSKIHITHFLISFRFLLTRQIVQETVPGHQV